MGKTSKQNRLLKRKILSLLLLFALLFTGSISTLSVRAATLEGEGTAVSPYLVKTPTDLYSISDDITAHYKLANDLDFKNIQRQSISEFKGVLDGDRYKIKNVNIVGENNVGIFGKLTNATIKNVNIETAIVNSTGNNTGVLFGYATSTSIQKCYIKDVTVNGITCIGSLGGTTIGTNINNCFSIDGKIESSGDAIGGIIGSFSNGILNQCYSNVSVESKGDYVGGLVGYAAIIEVNECFYNGSIKGLNAIGGLLGNQNGGTVKIKDSYALGSIISSTGAYIGGLVGNTSNDLTIRNSYSAMSINSTTKMGINLSSTTDNTKNTYFDSVLSEITTPLVQVRTTEQMYQQSNYVDWDFDTVWTIEDGKGYPTLQFASIKTENPNPVKNVLKIILAKDEQLRLNLLNEQQEDDVTWESSNESVATVSAVGLLKAIDKGDVKISLKNDEDILIDQVNVLVVDKITDQRITVDLNVDETFRMTVDDNTNSATVNWSVMDSAVATISAKGRVTANAKGLTIVTATNDQGEIIGTVYVRVR